VCGEVERNAKESVAVVVQVLCCICMFVVTGNFACAAPGSRFESLFPFARWRWNTREKVWRT